jgi:asparagine synthase (glutamine-hydrolysing)
MCGFVGEIGLKPTVTRSRLYRMNNQLIHRGPDQSGIYISGDRRWGVAHRRLCVLDIEGGKQPMRDCKRNLVIVYNGEVYDHERLRNELAAKGWSFQTRSDTEVVLALYATYGLEMFDHLRGEFAFVIIDEGNRRAVMVRDRMGLKPLFYTRTKDSLLFASEIKALFHAPEVERRIDPDGFAAAVSVADVPGQTIFAGIRQVRHSHHLCVQLDTLETSEHRYWDAFANRRTDISNSPGAQIEAVRHEVDAAIKLRLRADVPIGAYLSGGIDSSIVTSVMARAVDKVDAFALEFVESRRHNEFPYAQMMAQRYPNIALHRIKVTYDSMVRKLPETVWHLERPFGNLHSVAKIIQSQYAREYVVAVLTGDGGDECFCGYSTHWLQHALQQANYSLAAIRDRLKRMKREAKQIGGNRYYLTGGLARRIGKDSDVFVDRLGFRPCDLATAMDAYLRLRWLMHPDFIRRIERPPVERLADTLARSMPPADHWPHATLLQYVQFNSSVPEYIATISDRAEWAGSVEARPPLFDHKVAELALALPIEMKLAGDREKYVLREAYKDDLPAEIVDRRKQAFLAPPAPYNTAFGRSLIEDYLNANAVKAAEIWDPRKVAMLRAARRAMPHNRIINLIVTIVLTSQIVHQKFVQLG